MSSCIFAQTSPHPAGFTLRPSSTADRTFLWELKKNSFYDYVTRIWGWDEADQLQRFDECVAGNPIEMICINEIPVGMIQCCRHDDHVFVENIMVLDTWRGKGIGARVLSAIISEARAASCPVHLRVFKINTDAQRLYERLGFIRSGEHDQWFLYEIR